MRQIATLLAAAVAAAAVVAVGLSTAPAQAHDGWGYQWGNYQSREPAWSEQEWRERAWRRHEWRERHPWYPAYYRNYGYYSPPTYYGYYR